MLAGFVAFAPRLLAAAAADPSHPALDIRNMGDWLAVSGLRVALIVVGSLVAVRIAWIIVGRVERTAEKRLARGDADAVRRAKTVGQVLRNFLAGVFVFLGGALVLRELGVDVGPLLASAGVAGVAIGFGAQFLVRDLIAGVFILYENQFDVGDIVMGADVSGVVECLNLRTTMLRDMDGRLHVIPNGEFKVITNVTRDYHVAVVDIGVAYGQDLTRVRAVIEAELRGLGEDPAVGAYLLEPGTILGVEAFFDLHYTVRVTIRAERAGYSAVKRAFQERIVLAFHREGIAMRVAPGAVT